jgi:hypothetical protein
VAEAMLPTAVEILEGLNSCVMIEVVGQGSTYE